MPSGTPSPVPGPSGINTRNLQQQQQPSGGTLLTATSSSCGSDSTTPPQPGKFFQRLTSYKNKETLSASAPMAIETILCMGS